MLCMSVLFCCVVLSHVMVWQVVFFLSACLPACLSVCLCLSSLSSLSVCLPAWLSVSVSVSVCLSVCIRVYTYVCMKCNVVMFCQVM